MLKLLMLSITKAECGTDEPPMRLDKVLMDHMRSSKVKSSALDASGRALLAPNISAAFIICRGGHIQTVSVQAASSRLAWCKVTRWYWRREVVHS